MVTSARYFDLVREMKNAYNHRLRLVESAQQRGIEPTARLFATTVPTVRKWLRRYKQQGPSGLLEYGRAAHHQPRRTPPEVEQRVIELRKIFSACFRRCFWITTATMQGDTMCLGFPSEQSLNRSLMSSEQRLNTPLGRSCEGTTTGFGTAPGLCAPIDCAFLHLSC